MAITISTHNGSRVDLPHNRREAWRVEAENKKWEEKHPGQLRIDPNGKHEILIDHGSLKECYHRLFDEALKEWNDRQMKTGHPDRVIKDYLNYIKAHEHDTRHSKHPVYEIIYTVGSRDNPVPEEVAEKILKEMAAGFEERNPNLYVVCQAYHADEAGSQHVHTSYIGVAHDMKRGMSTQNALKEAFRQQGIVGDRYNTAQMQWERKENEYLEQICNKYGLEVSHPQRGSKQEHLEYEEYRISKQIKEKQAELNKLTNLPGGTTLIKKGRLEQLEQVEMKYQESLPQIEDASRNLKAATEAMHAYMRKVDELEKDKQEFDARVNEAANKKVELISNKAFDFIRSMGLWDKFLHFSDQIIEKLGSSMGL